MQALLIVEPFDPIDDVELGNRPGFVTKKMDTLDLQRLEKAFHRCVIPTVGSPAHRLNQSKKRCTSLSQSLVPSARHRYSPCAILTAQSIRSPKWATINTGRRHFGSG